MGWSGERMRYSVQVLDHLRLWFICLFLLFLHLFHFICSCTCVWLVILTFNSQKGKYCPTNLDVPRRRNVKRLFHNPMTFLTCSAFTNRGLFSYGQILYDMISLYVFLLQHNLNIYATIQLYAIILSLTLFAIDDMWSFLV